MMARFQRWMYGRYGNDALGRFLLMVALVLAVLSYLPRLQVLSLVALLVLLWSNVRCFSKNIPRRRAELETFLRLKGKWTTAWSLRKRMWRERKTHRYVKCKHCRAVLRVPRGRGTVQVGCPRCKGDTTVRT